MSKDGVWRRNAIAAGESQVQSAAHAVARNRGVDRSREVRDSLHQLLAYLGKLIRGRATKCGDLSQFGPGGEESIVAGEDERARRVRQFLNSLGEGKHEGSGQAIGAVFGLNAKNAGAVFVFDVESRP